MKKTIIFQSIDEKRLAAEVNEIHAADPAGLEVVFKVASKLTADGRIVPLYVAIMTFEVKEFNC